MRGLSGRCDVRRCGRLIKRRFGQFYDAAAKDLVSIEEDHRLPGRDGALRLFEFNPETAIYGPESSGRFGTLVANLRRYACSRAGRLAGHPCWI